MDGRALLMAKTVNAGPILDPYRYRPSTTDHSGGCTMTDHEEPQYPMHARMAALADATHAAGDFLRWLHANGYHICTADASGYRFSGKTPEGLLAGWTGIDVTALKAEKAAMATAAREAQARREALSPLLPAA